MDSAIMNQVLQKPSKIPVFKKAKILNPVKASTGKCNVDQFKYCRNCLILKDNLSVFEQNVTTLLKENNELRKQLAMANQNLAIVNLLNDNLQSNENVKEITFDTADQSAYSQVDNCDSINLKTDYYDLENKPYLSVHGNPFSEFDVTKLDKETKYSHKLFSRDVKFYGDIAYHYNNITHSACAVPEKSYILEIINRVKLLFPYYVFNSVLINRYIDGDCFIPMHSDDEINIKPDSNILTISLGESRAIDFQDKNCQNDSRTSLMLHHGDAFIMSAKSQSKFKHGIAKSKEKSLRISLTFRELINPGVKTSKLNSPANSVDKSLLHLSRTQNTTTSSVSVSSNVNNILDAHLTLPPPVIQPHTHGSIQEMDLPSTSSFDTIYISSSMFSDLDHNKLSSPAHRSKVFFFRGATAGGILSRLQNESDFLNLDKSTIKQIFLMCGTNDVDNILGVRKTFHSDVNIDSSKYDSLKLQKSLSDIRNLANYLCSLMPGANVNILNILPRNSYMRNLVINDLNSYIKGLCSHENKLFYINTEYKIKLFSSDSGFRKGLFFKQIGSDNVHLNYKGVVRLGRHLKFLAHLDCPR